MTMETQFVGKENSSNKATPWYVARTNIKCEDRARMGLDAAGYPVFLPILRKWVRHARLKKKVELPLFPRYLFVGVDLMNQSFLEVRRTDGVESILCNCGQPSTVSDAFIANLRWHEQAGVFDETKAVLNMAEGDLVKVMKGPLAGHVGRLKSSDEKARVEVLFDLLGRDHPVRFELANVRPAS